MKKTSSISFLTILCFLLTIKSLFAQNSIIEIPLQQQIEKSSLIVEGKVISQKSFWGDQKKNIYTSNTIEVFKVFKGIGVSYIDVITLGGVVGLKAQISSHSLQLSLNKQGLFILNTSNKLNNVLAKSTRKRYETYSGIQGFYNYNVATNTARNIFKSHKDIETSFYQKIQNISKSKIKTIKHNNLTFNKSNKNNLSKSVLAVSITNISPTSIAAGQASNKLTITGSGFGTTKGSIGFKNADDGGATLTSELTAPFTPTPLDSQILSWNDTEIVVEVPSEAGTGTVTVFHNSDGTSATSSQILTITHAFINVNSNNNAYRTQHLNDNSNGGYTWEMQTDFFNNTEAKAAFERAIDNWQCKTKINWTISNTPTSVDAIGVTDLSEPFDGSLDSDEVNVVRFDNGNELEAGILGRCTSWYSGCSTGGSPDINWFVSDLDIVFDDATTWYYGTEPSGIGTEFDFESVALHELGHGHQLAHVINTNDVMHFSISSSETKRTLSTNNIIAGNSVHSRSTTLNPSCLLSKSSMTNSTTCNLSIEEVESIKDITLFPNPTTGQIFIKTNASIKLTHVIIYDVSGRLISNIELSEDTTSINLKNASKGMYIINFHSEEGITTKKILLH